MELKGIKNIKKVINVQPAAEGSGANLSRVLGYSDTDKIDPFLVLDIFDSVKSEGHIKDFCIRNHTGVETLTYLIHGIINYKDTNGNLGQIIGGQAQWVNYGSAILHKKIPQKHGRMLGLHIWINVPENKKISKIPYLNIHQNDMPKIEEKNCTVKIITGKYKDIEGPYSQSINPLILDIKVKPGYDFLHVIPEAFNSFIYILEGSGAFGNSINQIGENTAVILDDGDSVFIKSGKKGMRFILFAGQPIKEPIPCGRKAVMNAEEKLNRTFLNLHTGRVLQ